MKPNWKKHLLFAMPTLALLFLFFFGSGISLPALTPLMESRIFGKIFKSV